MTRAAIYAGMSTDKQNELSPARLRHWRTLRWVLASLVLAGCATAPTYHYVENSRTFERPYDAIWEDLMEWFTSSEVAVRTLERASGVVYAERAVVSASWPADCGKPPLLVTVGSRTMSLNVFVKKVDDLRTAVTVNMTVTETRRNSQTSWSMECFSTGELEASLLDSLEQ